MDLDTEARRLLESIHMENRLTPDLRRNFGECLSEILDCAVRESKTITEENDASPVEKTG